MGLGGSRDLAICSDPDSQKKHPTLANCTLTPDNWRPPVCLVGGTREQVGLCLSVSVSVSVCARCLAYCLSVCLSVCLSIYLSVWLSDCLSVAHGNSA